MRLFFFILISIIELGTLNAQVVVDTDYKGFIGESCFYWVSPSDDISLQGALIAKSQHKFKPIKSDVFEASSAIPVYWFYVELKSKIDEDVWLNINNSNLLEIDVYTLGTDNSIISSFQTGSLAPSDSRQFDTETFWFPILKEDNKNKVTVMIRLRAAINMEAPFEVGTFQALLKTKKKSDLLAVLFIGAMLIMFVYNLLLYVYSRDRIYFIYSFYIISVMFGTTYLNNYPIIALFAGQHIVYYCTAAWLWTTFVGIGLFGIEYLNMSVKYRRLYHAIRIELVVLISLGIINLFVEAARLAVYYEGAVVIFYITAIITAYYVHFKERNSKTRLYALGWTLVIFGGVLYILVINDILPYHPLLRNAQYIGVLSEVLIFSIALARRLNELKKEQEKLNLELEITNVKLIQNNESLDSFNYHVSHDLKTVLNNSNALARMVMKYNDKHDEQKVKEITTKLLTVTQNGAETVQSFLTLGKVDSLFRKEQRAKIFIKKEIERIISSHQIYLCLTWLKCETDYILMHQKAFESIFLNLLTNSVKYAIDAPRVELSVVVLEDSVQFIYKDFGMGIDLEKYGHLLFKPFERGGADKKIEGTGVGLNIVKRIVQMYKGEIQLQSKVGQGITIIINFPKKDVISADDN